MRKTRIVKTPPESCWKPAEIARFENVDKSVVIDWIHKGYFKNVRRLPGSTGDFRIPDSSYREFIEAQTMASTKGDL